MSARNDVVPRHHCLRLVLLLPVALLLTACGHLVSLVPDGQWHTVYSIQVPDRAVETTVVGTTAPRSECEPSRIAQPTEVRIVQVESFQVLGELPDRLADAAPRADGIPITTADSGPYDLTLDGASRVVRMSTGKQLLVRTRDRCAALRLFHLRDRR
jgi:hypothetical protein